MAVIVGQKSIAIMDDQNPDIKTLSFQEKYGHIVDFEWIDEGDLLVAFSLGNVIAMSKGIIGPNHGRRLINVIFIR
jgi:hypothetical protein